MIKRILTIVIVLSLVVGCTEVQKKNDSQHSQHLDKFVDKLNYFELESMYNKLKEDIPIKTQLYYESILANAYNQPLVSNRLIDDYLTKNNDIDTITKRLLEIKLTNLIHLSQYSKALQVNEKLQKEYSALLDSTDIEDLNNTHKIWQALRDVSPQKVLKKGDITLPIIKDKAGLSTIETKIGDSTKNFVFDTGANFSVIQKSVAQRLGMKIIQANFNVAAATGLEVKSDLAVAAKMELGSITLTNVVFLVFDDKDLSFPSINYEINGIIGFPVIRALEEIQIIKGEEKEKLYIPKRPTDYGINNLVLDEFIPIVKANINGGVSSMNFDTGAQQTSLYSSFFKKYRKDIESTNKQATLQTGGAGGYTSVEGYLLDTVNISIAGSSATIYNIQLFPERLGETDKLDGNLGQDYIKQFDTLVISFKYSSLIFK